MPGSPSHSWTLAVTLYLLIGCIWRGVCADSGNETESVLSAALVSLKSPEYVKGNSLGYFALFSALPEKARDSIVWVPAEGNEEGCESYELPQRAQPVIVLVRRGTCSFIKKTWLAQVAGATGIIIVSDDDVPLEMSGNASDAGGDISIFSVSVGKDIGDRMIGSLRLHDPAPLVVSVSIYERVLWNISELIIMLMATGLVAAGAYFSTADMREGSPVAQSPGEVVELTYWEAGGMCALGSCVLVVLFFLMKYLIYFIIFVFCMGGASTLVQFGSMFLQYWAPSTKKKAMTVPCIGKVSQAELLSLPVAAAVVGLWFVWRNEPFGWIPQDIIGAGFLCMFQRTLRLPNIKVAALLLSCMFFFDIFWVFLSPYIFHKSVMVEVAKGGGTHQTVPLLLVIPTIGDVLPGVRMLGFGDVALPGLLISYLLRFDKICKRQSLLEGYFVFSVAAYFCGLSVTIYVLVTTASAQPALLYLVPATLGTTFLLSCCRGELSALWEGRPVRKKPTAEMQNLADGARDLENTDAAE